jgi:hypothetical protein
MPVPSTAVSPKTAALAPIAARRRTDPEACRHWFNFIEFRPFGFEEREGLLACEKDSGPNLSATHVFEMNSDRLVDGAFRKT